MKKYILFLWTSFLLAVPMACDTPHNCGGPETIELTYKNNGETIRVHEDDTIVVDLNGIVPNDYTWISSLLINNVIEVESTNWDRTVFTFTAVGPGTDVINISAVPPWPGDKERPEPFRVTVIVR